MLSAGLAQSRPGILKKSDFMGQHMGCWAPSIIPIVSPGGLKSLGHAKMDPVDFGKGRGTAPV